MQHAINWNQNTLGTPWAQRRNSGDDDTTTQLWTSDMFLVILAEEGCNNDAISNMRTTHCVWFASNISVEKSFATSIGMMSIWCFEEMFVFKLHDSATINWKSCLPNISISESIFQKSSHCDKKSVLTNPTSNWMKLRWYLLIELWKLIWFSQIPRFFNYIGGKQ